MDNEGYDSNGRRISLTISHDGDTEINERRTDHCHAPVSSEDVLAKNQLIAVSCFCFLFMVAEIVGGTLANSLAIATDATHLACDLTGFLISLFSIWIAKKPPSKKLSFGYYRAAEVIGALCSILLIWVVTVILVAMAVKRIQNNEFEVGGQPMIITASLGVIFNIIMGVVLHSGLCKSCSNIKTSFGHGHSHGGHGHSHEERHTRLSFKGSTNINVRAAFIHVVGDLIQSVGVFVAAIIIMIKPEYKLADPICTFIFSFLVLCTTLTVLRDVGNIIMEGVPRSISYSSVKQSLSSLPGVISVHSLNIWSLTVDKIALNVHLAIEDTTDWRKVLQTSVQLLRTQYNIDHPTVQVEPYNDLDMRDCIRCLHP
ncbi:hypothetical protein HELRODRAFT_65752 [Helobdella robusta]|uniref:Uncharacterized protein n=1 Tax=Helobdella robusta TaxID=6412 RepID=T1FYC3_HELRO|nr:hypothetical protein HELRODRAFT_65752 [Helobdella robusta]ESO01905.1 hypothetical protein HELRODRAFT_65752 [Helobdella robusta]